MHRAGLLRPGWIHPVTGCVGVDPSGSSQVLVTRGEPLGTLLMTVPVSGRRPDGEPALGNMVSPMLVSVSATGGVPDRLRRVTAQVRAHKEAATGPPPIALLGWLFRPLAALGGFRWYMDHQHRFHTLVSHVRGPAEPVAFGGCRITSAIPAGGARAGTSRCTSRCSPTRAHSP